MGNITNVIGTNQKRCIQTVLNIFIKHWTNEIWTLSFPCLKQLAYGLLLLSEFIILKFQLINLDCRKMWCFDEKIFYSNWNSVDSNLIECEVNDIRVKADLFSFNCSPSHTPHIFCFGFRTHVIRYLLFILLVSIWSSFFVRSTESNRWKSIMNSWFWEQV